METTVGVARRGGGGGDGAVLAPVLVAPVGAAVHRLADDLGADLRLGGDLRGGLRRRLRLVGPGATRGECGDGEQPEGGDRDRGGDLGACVVHGRHHRPRPAKRPPTPG